MTKTTNKPLVVRLRPDTRELLDRAAEDQRRSLASIVDEAVREQLRTRYADVRHRIDLLLAGVK
jgi:uncharacterized protein (DUF1778 family)